MVLVSAWLSTYNLSSQKLSGYSIKPPVSKWIGLKKKPSLVSSLHLETGFFLTLKVLNVWSQGREKNGSPESGHLKISGQPEPDVMSILGLSEGKSVKLIEKSRPVRRVMKSELRFTPVPDCRFWQIPLFLAGSPRQANPKTRRGKALLEKRIPRQCRSRKVLE